MKGELSHILEARNRKKKNNDDRRVAMYAFYASRGLAIPFELADNQEELAKYENLDVDSLSAPVNSEDDSF